MAEPVEMVAEAEAAVTDLSPATVAASFVVTLVYLTRLGITLIPPLPATPGHSLADRA